MGLSEETCSIGVDSRDNVVVKLALALSIIGSFVVNLDSGDRAESKQGDLDTWQHNSLTLTWLCDFTPGIKAFDLNEPVMTLITAILICEIVCIECHRQ
jgi:hypothetical protein